MDSNNQSLDLTGLSLNLTYEKNCIEWHGNETFSFQLSNFLFFIAFLTPHNASNQIGDLLFRLLITMGCSIHVIWIISIKDHCFFNFIIFFWPIFLFINFLHSFHLTYKLSPASLPKKFIKLYDTLFEPVKMNKKEFKILTQHALVINLNRGENYLLENESPINEKVGILLEGRLDVTQNDSFLHQIYPNDFIDSPEFKYIELYSQTEQITHPLTAYTDDRTCTNCKQVRSEMETGTTKSMNKISGAKATEANEVLKLKKATKSKLHPTASKHEKNCVFNKQTATNRSIMTTNRSNKEINILSIDSPLKEREFEFGSVNKLAQVTITASENCKLLCWKRDLLVNDTFAKNARLRTIFHNLIGKDIINKLYLVNEEQRNRQQKIIGDSNLSLDQASPILASKLLAHNPLKGDNLLSKFREINLLNAYPSLPHESMMYLNPYNRNSNILNQPDVLRAPPLATLNPYLPYYQYSPYHHPHFMNNQSILPLINPLLSSPLHLEQERAANNKQQAANTEMNI